MRVAAHTIGVRGSRKPQGSTFRPVRLPIIFAFPLYNVIVGSAASFLTRVIMKGPVAKSAS